MEAPKGGLRGEEGGAHLGRRVVLRNLSRITTQRKDARASNATVFVLSSNSDVTLGLRSCDPAGVSIQGCEFSLGPIAAIDQTRSRACEMAFQQRLCAG